MKVELTTDQVSLLLQAISARRRVIVDYLAIRPPPQAKGMLENDDKEYRKLYSLLIEPMLRKRIKDKT